MSYFRKVFKKARGNIVTPEEALQEVGIPYTIKGQNLVFRCFNTVAHSNGDRNPSCNMDKDSGVYRCWSCDNRGNLITLFKAFNRNPSAFFQDNSFYSKPKEQVREFHKDINILIRGNLYHPSKDETVQAYLKKISVHPDFVEQYNVTYCTYAEMIAEHVEGIRDPIRMTNRIIFPVKHEGKLINMEGRYYLPIEEGIKIKKVLYPPGCTTRYLFNFENCDLTKPVIVLEGIKDLCKVWNITRNVVSTFSNNVTTEMLKQLSQFTNDIIFFINNDKAGWHGIKKVSEECIDKEFKVCYNPVEGLDANNTSFPEIESLISKAKYFVDYQLDKAFKFKQDYEW
jgi:hypothetical protein